MRLILLLLLAGCAHAPVRLLCTAAPVWDLVRRKFNRRADPPPEAT